ncbi:hypothetical protein DFP73DRAFT_559995 [Morchella snyderi]|nr:hypothetical protein DFP73DRAFT_559995 [Morchella snyderi]
MRVSYRERLGPSAAVQSNSKVGTIHKAPPRPAYTYSTPTYHPPSFPTACPPTASNPTQPTQHEKATLTVLCITLHTIPTSFSLPACLLACPPSRANLRYVRREESLQIQIQKQHHTHTHTPLPHAQRDLKPRACTFLDGGGGCPGVLGAGIGASCFGEWALGCLSERVTRRGGSGGDVFALHLHSYSTERGGVVSSLASKEVLLLLWQLVAISSN